MRNRSREVTRRSRWADLVLMVLIACFIFALATPKDSYSTPLSEVAELTRAGQVEAITVTGDQVAARLADGNTLYSLKEPGMPVAEALAYYGVAPEQLAAVETQVTPPSPWDTVFSALLPVIPILLIGMLILRAVSGPRQQQAGTAQPVNVEHKGRRVETDKITTTFADVAGVDEAAEELREIVEFLRAPDRFTALGARVPRGVLLVGPPGTGKTLLARAVAGEAGGNFYSINASEFVEVYVGVGAARVRDLFRQAKENAPSIVFIDEIDTIGRKRRDNAVSVNEEREQTLNQILVEMDGFDTNTNVVVLAATNRPDVLDPALLRPGRFDRRVRVDPPDRAGREAILGIHTRDKPLDESVDLSVIAAASAGFTGADLANLANEAAILAARRGKTAIAMAEVEEAIDRITAGPERKGRLMSARERRIVAYHEAGHALVALATNRGAAVQKVSIVARGASGGQTRLLAEDRYLWSRSDLLSSLAWALGGRAAEELVMGEVTTGSENDLRQASRVARKMVAELGMSETLGPVALGGDESEPWMGQSVSHDTANQVDAEVRRLICEAYERACGVLRERRPTLDAVAAALLERDTLSREELEAICLQHEGVTV